MLNTARILIQSSFVASSTMLLLASCSGNGTSQLASNAATANRDAVRAKAASITQLDGTSIYSLQVENSLLNLSINSSSGKLIQNSSAAGDALQQFSLRSVGNNLYQIVALANGNCLSADGSSSDVWSSFSTKICSTSQGSQIFSLAIQSDSAFIIQPYSGQSGMCLDVQNASLAAGAPIIQYPCNYTTNERFAFSITGQSSAATPLPSSSPFGTACAAGSICNYSNAAEDENVSVSCAAGVLTVQSATYGAGTATESCLAYAQASCQGLASCQIAFSNNACGGDPIYGTVKSGQLSVSCSSPVVAATPNPTPTPTPIPAPTGQAFGSCNSSSCNFIGASENTTVSAACSQGVLTVTSATYSANSYSESCLSYAQSICNGKSSCSPNFNNSSCGGDPQYGIVKTASMSVSCAAPAATPTPTPVPISTPTPAPVATPLPSNGSFTGMSIQESIYTAYGDSITSGTGASAYFATAYAPLLAADAGATMHNYGVAGMLSCNIAALGVFGHPAPQISDGAAYVTLMGGTNDANVGNIGPAEINFNMCEQASVSWLSIPNTSKSQAQSTSCVKTGSWSVDGSKPDAEMVSSTQGSSMDCSISTSGGPAYFWYGVSDGNGGAFNYSVDGGNTISLNSASSVAMANGNGTEAAGVFMTRVSGLAAGTHHIRFTVTSATSSSNSVMIFGVGTPSSTNPGPHVFVGGVPYQRDDNRSATTAKFNADVIANVNTLQADGLPVHFVNVRNYLHGTSTDMQDTLHPNDTGHLELKNAFEATIRGN